jgi:ATP-dependent Lon protease
MPDTIAPVTIFVSLASPMTGCPIPPATAMTEEISLRGLALPARTRRDFDAIPASARDWIRFVWLETADDVIAAAIGTGAPAVES